MKYRKKELYIWLHSFLCENNLPIYYNFNTVLKQMGAIWPITLCLGCKLTGGGWYKNTKITYKNDLCFIRLEFSVLAFQHVLQPVYKELNSWGNQSSVQIDAAQRTWKQVYQTEQVHNIQLIRPDLGLIWGDLIQFNTRFHIAALQLGMHINISAWDDNGLNATYGHWPNAGIVTAVMCRYHDGTLLHQRLHYSYSADAFVQSDLRLTYAKQGPIPLEQRGALLRGPTAVATRGAGTNNLSGSQS